MDAQVSTSATDALFARLRAQSVTPPGETENASDLASLLVNFRKHLRPHLIVVIEAAWRQVCEWRATSSHEVYQRRDATTIQKLSATQIADLLHYSPEDFFLNLAEVLLMMWDSALIVTLPRFPDLVRECDDFLSDHPDFQRDGGYGYPAALIARFRTAPKGKGKPYFLHRRFKASGRIAEQAGRLHNYILPELTPATAIVTGLAYLAWQETDGDAPRMARLLKNSHPLLLNWANLPTGTFTLIRAALIDASNTMLKASAFKIEDEGTESERFALTSRTIAALEAALPDSDDPTVKYRLGCPALAAKTPTPRSNPVTELLDWTFELYKVHRLKIKK